MNIGIVGLGHLGKVHLRLLNEISEFVVNGIYDIDQTITDELSQRYKVKNCSSYNELLDLNDAICIITPTPTHFELASIAIKQGKHVFIEKPSTSDLDDTKKLLRLAREAGVIVQVGHVERYNPAFVAAKPYIKTPLFYEIHRLASYNVRGTDVSVVLDLMIHDIDLVLCTVKSKVKRISASGTAIVSDSADLVNARIEFENGCVANLTANRISLADTRKMRVFQKEECITIDLLNKSLLISKIDKVIDPSKNQGVLINTGTKSQQYLIHQQHPVIQPSNAIKTELEDFYKSITQSKPVEVSLKDAELALAIAVEIEEQIKLSSR